MFETSQKSTGTRYTTTVAFLVMAFIFSPAVLIVSRPMGYLSISLAVACSAGCIALAWVNWKRSSQLFIPSIVIQRAVAK
jgi:hypothetical protein